MSSEQMDFDLRRTAGKPQPHAGDGTFQGENLSIAIRPDRAAAAAAQSIARDYRELYRIDRQPLSDRRLHVGLMGLEHAAVHDQSLVDDARAAIDSVRFEPFEVTFDSVVSLRSRTSRPIALAATAPSPALLSVVHRLADKLDGLDGLGVLPARPRQVSLLHMTLIHYDKPVMPEHLSKPIRWMVDRLWLVGSPVGQGACEFLWPPDRRTNA